MYIFHNQCYDYLISYAMVYVAQLYFLVKVDPSQILFILFLLKFFEVSELFKATLADNVTNAV